IKNFIRLVVASNNEWVVPAGPSERRFCVIDAQPNRKQDHAYFASINDDMNNGGREALMHFLLNYDLTGVNLRALPKTSALQDQKIRSMDPIEKWWLDCLERGYVGTEAGWETSIETKKVQESLVATASMAGSKTHATGMILGMTLKKLVPGFKKVR